MKVYSYQSMNKDKLATLRENSLWFTNPLMFNDVFELQVPVKHQEVHKYTPQYIRELMKVYTQGPGGRGKLFNPEIMLWYANWANNPDSNDINSQRFHLHVSILSERVLEQVGICCFTPHADSELMWAYYADSHRGFCVGYEIDQSSLDNENYDFKPVTYSSQRPMIDFWEFLFTDVSEKVLYTKSASWSHEREWRLVALKSKARIDFANEHGFKTIVPDGIRITDFILGARISEQNENDLRKIAKELHELTGQKIEVRRIVHERPVYQLSVSDPC